jgi:type I restriction enzyme S subunit
VANTVGTDFKKYKIVKRNQFTYVPDTSRRGDKMGIAMLQNHDQALVSQAYTVFEVVDTEKLSPEYLMMWFRRTEFDRYARFKSHGSVREMFDWDEMCEVELPIPSIEQQHKLVREYNVVNDRIMLNEQIYQKLEYTSQAIYKQWFLDFDFPISKKYAESIGKVDLENKPYKSSGGEMEYCDELEREIPKGWLYGKLGDHLIINYGKSLPESKRISGTYGVYSSAGLTGSHNKYLTDETCIVIGRKGSIGKLYFVDKPIFCIDTAYFIKESDSTFPLSFTYRILLSLNLPELNEDSAVPGLNRNTVYNLPVVKPLNEVMSEYNRLISKMRIHQTNIQEENNSLVEFKKISNTRMTKV